VLSKRRPLAYAGPPLIIVAIASMSCSQSKPTAKNAEPQSTRINEASFRLTLPGTWTSAQSTDPNRRDYHTDSEWLTVSVMGSLFGAPGAMSRDDKVARFRYWVSRRRAVETKVSEGAKITLTEPLFGESDGVFAARYAGVDTGRQRRFHCVLLASSSAFEVFYYEALNMTEQAAEERAKAIFNSVDIPR
jgi:hypothetical protein